MATKRTKHSGPRRKKAAPRAYATGKGASVKTKPAASSKRPKKTPRRPKATAPGSASQTPRDLAQPPEALLVATRAAESVGAIVQALLASESWTPALARSRPATPVLVERLDLEDSYYYIVPVQVGPAETARIRIDAKTGHFMDATAVEKSEEQITPYLTWPDVLQRLTAAPIVLVDQRIRWVRPEAVGRHPVLVWKPCNESRSPFTPFYQCSVADTLVYIRTDGTYFAQLTFPSPGA